LSKTVCFSFIAKSSAQKKLLVYIIVHRKELLDQTEARLISDGVDLNFVKVLMVQTVSRNISKFPEPKLMIWDEAHHGTAASYKKLLEKWPNSWLLGVTATPCRTDGSGLNSVFQSMVQGPTMRELINMGFLSEFKIYAPPTPINVKKLKVLGGDYSKDSLESEFSKPSISGNLISHYKKFADGKQCMICN
jgi:superfamily II DNA or RNA helicase